jgi:hypothetical protein
MTNIDMNVERELTDGELESELSPSELMSVGGGDGPAKTCVQSCEQVKGTTVVVCSPVICFWATVKTPLGRGPKILLPRRGIRSGLGDQTKAKLTKDELNEQELDKASGGSFSFGAKLPGGRKILTTPLTVKPPSFDATKAALHLVRPPQLAASFISCIPAMSPVGTFPT